MIRRLSGYAFLGITVAVFGLGTLGAVTRGAAPEKSSAMPVAHFHHLHLNTLDPAAAK